LTGFQAPTIALVEAWLVLLSLPSLLVGSALLAGSLAVEAVEVAESLCGAPP
jgi:hypothetical protein